MDEHKREGILFWAAMIIMYFPFRKKILMKGKMKSKLILTLLTGPPCRVVSVK